MKKLVISLIAVCLTFSLCACTPAPAESSEQTVTATPGFTQCPTSTPVDTYETAEVTETPTEVPSDTPVPTPTVSAPTMYSSYAHLVSFDPSTGIAQFDYFEMLRGDDAVEYLVEHDGYTQAEAQNIVDDYADSEFIEKNTNPQLRAIDLTNLSLSLMYQPDGTQMPGAEPVPSTYSDFLAIYTLNPSLLLDSFFYYIHVNAAGNVYFVEQVYWP